MTEEKRYKGEIVAERRRNLDFSLEFGKVCIGLTADLPKYSRKERINYYNKKISKIWECRIWKKQYSLMRNADNVSTMKF